MTGERRKVNLEQLRSDRQSRDADSAKKITELIKLYLNLREAKGGSRNQLLQVEQNLTERLRARAEEMIAMLEEGYNQVALIKGVPLLDLKNSPEDREVLRKFWGIDLEKPPYNVDISTEEGLKRFLEFYNKHGKED